MDISTRQGPAPLRLHSLITDYPNTRALRAGSIASPRIAFDLEEVTVIHEQFRPLIRDGKFDVAELATVTYLQAREQGAPLVLLPFVMNAKFQHDTLVHNTARSTLRPQDLAGRRIGVRSYSQTTVVWVRGILETEYGVAPGDVTWVALDDAHVAGQIDPPNCERAPKGAKLMQMLLDGSIDAAVLAPKFVTDPRVQPMIADVAAVAADWHRRTGICPMNHMAVVRQGMAPDVVAEVFRLLAASKQAAPAKTPDLTPMGVEALRPSLEALIGYAHSSGVIRRRLTVDELFDDVTRGLTA